MRTLTILSIILAFTVSCKESKNSTQTTTNTAKSAEEIADSTVRAIKRSFQADSPAATFDSFKKAVQMGDGSSAVEMLSEQSLDYYGDIMNKVNTAGSGTVKSLPVSEQVMVLMSRVVMPEYGLKNMDNASFFKGLVETGCIDKVAIGLIEIGNIEVNGNTASAPVIIKQAPANVNVGFVQTEDGAWKLNLANAVPKAVTYYQGRFASAGIDLDTHIKNTIKAFTKNGEFPANIYAPLQ